MSWIHANKSGAGQYDPPRVNVVRKMSKPYFLYLPFSQGSPRTWSKDFRILN
jgi:hypothetical protein